MAADPADRRTVIEAALAAALSRQGVARVSELDLGRIATEIAAAWSEDEAGNPIDPEGDGLTPTELNASNDR